MNTSKLLVAVVVLQGLTLVSLWSGNGGAAALPAAQAQVVDPGAQRLMLLDEQRQTNAKLEQMVGLLKGELQVRVVTDDEAKDAPAKGK